MAGCPTDDTLGAHVHRALDPAESARVTSHLDDCTACQQVVIAAVRAATPVTVALGTPPLLVPGLPRRRGARVGRYELRALLGAGGMGEVYEAYDGELDRAIALKVLRPELAGAAAVLAERLVRESRLMAKLAHPAVITVHDIGRDGDTVFIAMELVRGETLGAHVARKRPRWREVLALFARAGEGLVAAHAAGIVHRDFKPDNVLVELDDSDRAARLVVTDFGIARATGELEPTSAPRATIDVRLTATGTAIGTPAYMAPEQLAGKPVDARADVFAFAVALWEALYGQRPFAGRTVDEIRAAIATRPRPPRRGVPARVVRALERALAIEPEARWPDLRALLDELARVRARRRRAAIGAGATALVVAGIAGTALAYPRGVDPCARGFAYDVLGAHAVLATEPGVLATLDGKAAALVATQRATCRADREPSQPATVAACLDARRLELAGFADDVVADGAKWARQLVGTIGDPARCATPAPGLLSAHVPDDPALRRRVTALRYRAFEAEGARDAADFPRSLALASAVADDAKQVWPFAHAETLYLLGTVQSHGGDNKRGLATLREAAAVAEAAHDDYIAANAWIALAQDSAFDEGDLARGLEYATYADAAIDRIGRPPLVETLFLYVKGSTLVQADRDKEGEVLLRRAVELAKTDVPSLLPQTIQGLGFLYEQQGRYLDAAAAYRDALAHVPAVGGGAASAAIVFRERLAVNLSLLGKTDEALAIAREAVAIADRTLGADNVDRPVAHSTLAQVLDDAGQLPAALAEAHAAAAAIGGIEGQRSERYAEALQLEATVLDDLQRFADAAPLLARACDLIGFAGDGSSQQADCWLQHAISLSGLGRDRDALALIDKVLPAFVKAYGEVHPQVANALVARGTLRAQLGDRAHAIADLERAIDIFGKVQLADSHREAARQALAKLRAR